MPIMIETLSKFQDNDLLLGNVYITEVIRKRPLDFNDLLAFIESLEKENPLAHQAVLMHASSTCAGFKP